MPLTATRRRRKARVGVAARPRAFATDEANRGEPSMRTIAFLIAGLVLADDKNDDVIIATASK